MAIFDCFPFRFHFYSLSYVENYNRDKWLQELSAKRIAQTLFAQCGQNRSTIISYYLPEFSFFLSLVAILDRLEAFVAITLFPNRYFHLKKLEKQEFFKVTQLRMD